MSFFPVINSTLSADHLSAWIAQAYGFNEVVCSLFRTNTNHTYIVTAADGKYVLRVYRHSYYTRLIVSEELRLLLLLRSPDVAVSYPIEAVGKEYILEIPAPEGTRLAVLFSYAEGDKVRYISEEVSMNIGKTAALFHHTTVGEKLDRTDYTIEVLGGWAYSQIAKRFSENLDEMEFVRDCLRLLREAFSDSSLPVGIVHLDIWYDNMAIDKEGKITLFDFDNCGNGWLILDIGYYCMQLYNIEADKTAYERKKDAFIVGYQTIRHVSDAELKLIPYAGLAIWIYYLGLQAERFDYISNFFLSENYLKMLIGKAKEWLKYNAVEIG